jgi:hypothetical protein
MRSALTLFGTPFRPVEGNKELFASD